MGRGQVSVEYLVIVGLALGLLIPAVLFFYSFNEGSQISSIAANVRSAGDRAAPFQALEYGVSGVGPEENEIGIAGKWRRARRSCELTRGSPEGGSNAITRRPELEACPFSLGRGLPGAQLRPRRLDLEPAR